MNKFDEVLKARREEVRQQRSRALTMQRKRMKKERRIETIMTFSIIGFIITITILLMTMYSKLTQKDINNCINAGHTQQYCERGM